MTVQQCYLPVKIVAARIIAPVLFVGGLVTALVGLVIAAVIGVRPGVLLVFCGIAAIAIAQIIELLTTIANDLDAIRARLETGVLRDMAADLARLRAQLGRGVLGLLGA